MKTTKLFVTMGALFLASLTVTAQTVYDGATITDKELNGTARFVGMGGAMGALGGDISTIGTNPAGIGVFRSNDVMTTFGLSAYSTDNKTYDGNYTLDKTRADFDNIGFVYSTKIGNTTALRYVNFGFNYHRAKSFYRNMRFSGPLGTNSQTYQMASQADGISNWGNNPFDDNNIGWLSAIGWQGYVIDPAEDNSYLGMYDNGIGSLSVEERGGLDQYDINVALNINERVYLGLTIGAYDLNYKKTTYYTENYTGVNDGEGYDLCSWNKIVGAGIDIKLGAIIRPFEDSPFRFGLAVHTPTFYDLDYKTRAMITSDVYDPADDKVYNTVVKTSDALSTGGNMVRGFQLQTPWLFNFSLGSTIGSSFAFGAEYEFQDYSSMKFTDPDGYDDDFDFENSTRSMAKSVSTFRVGMEYKLLPEFAVRAGYNYRSAIFKDNAYKDLPYYSIQTDTDYANTQDRNTVTFGVGYRGKSFYADLAYKYDTCKSELFPFVNIDGNTINPGKATSVTNSRHQAMMTLGFRF